MKRIRHHYMKWEDWKEGMYQEIPAHHQQGAIDAAARLLRTPSLLLLAMRQVLRKWPTSAEQYLSNAASNRQAWLGQAACYLRMGTPDYLTKLAWHTLTANQQSQANAVADTVIDEWENAEENASAKRA